MVKRTKYIRRRLRYIVTYLSTLLLALTFHSCDSHTSSKTVQASNIKTLDFITNEGTWMNIDVSPDGSTILFDLLGDIYTMPIGGGRATPLRRANSWDVAPRYSPDGMKIAFLSDNSGTNHQLFVMDANGSNLRQVSKVESDHYGNDQTPPSWMPDSNYIINSIFHPKKYGIHSNEVIPISNREIYWDSPVASKTSKDIYYSFPIIPWDFYKGKQIYKLDGNDSITQITNHPKARALKPQLSNDGRWLAYGLSYYKLSDNKASPDRTALMLRDLKTGTERELIPTIGKLVFGHKENVYGEMPGYAFTPNNEVIIIAYNGKIHQIDIASGTNSIIPFSVHVLKDIVKPSKLNNNIALDSIKLKQFRWTTFSPNGKDVVFNAMGKLWLHNLKNQTTTRLTNSTEIELAPKFSPDGNQLVYSTWSSNNKGALHIYNVANKTSQKITDSTGFYINATWRPDGMSIAYIGASGENENYYQLSSDENLAIYILNLKTNATTRICNYKKVVASKDILPFSPLYFDEAGKHLLFTKTDDNNRSIHNLISVNIKTHAVTTRLKVYKVINYICPSPDGKSAVLVDRFNAHLIAHFDSLPADKNLSYSDIYENDSICKPISKKGASFVEWQGNNALRWSYANEIYEWQTDYIEPKWIADVNLVIKRPLHTNEEVIYTNARIITMKDNEVVDNGYLIVQSGRIKKVGKVSELSISENSKAVNLSGKTIIPGLIDTHAHYNVGSDSFLDFKPNYISNLAYGVTTIFDPSTETTEVFSLAEMVEAGTLIGPRVYSSGGPIIYMGGDQGAKIDTYQDAVQQVALLKKSGSIMVKSYILPKRNQRKWVVKAAQECGVGVTMESNSELICYNTGIMDGHNAIEHASFFTPLYKDMVTFYAQSGVQITSTFIDNFHKDVFFLNDSTVLNSKLKRFIKPKTLAGLNTNAQEKEDYNFKQTAKDLKKIIEAGGLVSAGSHGQYCAGISMHWELWLWGKGDILAMQILKAGTLTGAIKLGIEKDLGSIEAGKIADFLVLNANPLDNIRNTSNIKYVVKEGVVYDAQSMTQLYPMYKPLPESYIKTYKEWEAHKAPAPEKLF